MRSIGCILIAFLVVFGGCTGYQMYQIASKCEREPLIAEWATTDAARASLEEKLKALPGGQGRLELTQDELNAYARREIGDDKGERVRITLAPDGTVRIEASRTISRPIIGTYYANASVTGLLRIEDGLLQVERVDALRDLRQTFEPAPQKMVDELKEQAKKMVLRGVRALRNEGGKAIIEIDPAVGAPETKPKPDATPAPEKPAPAPTTGGGG